VVTFLFFDLTNQVVASDSQVVFRGIANPPDQSTESTLRLSFTNTLNLQRVFFCRKSEFKSCVPGTFRAPRRRGRRRSAAERKAHLSPFIDADIHRIRPVGVGNLNAGHSLHDLRLFAHAMPAERNVRHRHSEQCYAAVRRH